MSFRSRLIGVCAILLLLIGVLVLGIVFSPERVQARSAGRPLLALSSTEEVTGIEIDSPGAPAVTLARGASGWTATDQGRNHPVSTTRLQIFLHMLTGLTRGKMVSRDAAHFSELGLSDDTARHLILHRAPGTRDLGLLVGRRAPSGDEDYVRLQGENAAYLVRGSLAFFLSQDRAYWYELHVLPDDVQGTTVARITVRGSVKLAGSESTVVQGPYTLARVPGAQSGEWIVDESRPANRVAAGAMANALSLLEADDFADAPGGAAGGQGAAGGRSDVEVITLQGKAYSLSVRPDPATGKVLVTTSWSPWTYAVNPVLLQRAVRPLSVLLAQ